MKPISRIVGFLFSKDTNVFKLAMIAHSLGNFLFNILFARYVALHFHVALATVLVFIATVLKVGIMVALYDYYGKDIFGLEQAKNGQVTNKIVRKIESVLRHLAGKSKWLTFVTLILLDNFFGVVYMRKAHHAYRGIPKEDLKIVLLALGIVSISLVAGWEIVEIICNFFIWLMS
ncbi:MAG: hypothetical protein ACK4FA_02345 [Candidatus Paceibacteria bacterium]